MYVIIFVRQFGTFRENGPYIDNHITDYCDTYNLNLLLEQTSTNFHHGIAEHGCFSDAYKQMLPV